MSTRESWAWWAPWAIPVTEPPVRDALVTVRNGRIASIEGGISSEDAVTQGAECFPGCVLAPGFVNAHCHLEYAAYDGLVDGLSFTDWIGDHIRRKHRLNADQMLASAELGVQQALAHGITTVGDASFSGHAAQAMVAAGLRGRVYLEVFGAADEEQALATCLERLADLPSSELVEHGISPHAPYTVSERLYRLVADTGLPWMTHLFESRDELEFLRDSSGPLSVPFRERGMPLAVWERPPIQALADVLGPHVVAVHLVHPTPADLEVVAQTQTAVAHCPRSNARLGCGRMDLESCERAGVQVGLGTDSPSSAGAIDMFAEMRSALEQHRSATSDATRPSTQRLLEMATVDAARALGYTDLGSLTPGAHADLVACTVPETTDPVTAYVLTGSAAGMRSVAIGGTIVWRHDRNALPAAIARAAETRQLLALPTPHPAGQR